MDLSVVRRNEPQFLFVETSMVKAFAVFEGLKNVTEKYT